MAERLDGLLTAERESVADLSHRLRTPLTALRLQAETVTNPDEAAALLEDVKRVEAAVDSMIVEARRQPAGSSGTALTDLGDVVIHRSAFWQVLADEQGRATSIIVEPGEHLVAVPPGELGALVDVLIENVFGHTPQGAGYRVRVCDIDGGRSRLIIEDAGTGFDTVGVILRGARGSGSTGLGLDIISRTAERSGGSVRIGEAAGGGARVEVTFGAVSDPDAEESAV